MLKVRFRRSAKREMFELDDETFLRVARAILDLQEDPRPRGHDKVAGREDQCRIWAGREHRVLYEIDEKAGRVIIVGVRRKDESTYKEGNRRSNTSGFRGQVKGTGRRG